VRYCPPPPIGGAWDSAGSTSTALGRPMSPLRVCGGRCCVYHLEPLRASTSRCGHRPCRASRHPAHLRTAPPCCPPALAIQTWGSGGHQGCGPRQRRVRRAVQSRLRRARRQLVPKGGRRAGVFLFFVQCLTPPVCAFCVSRGRGGGGGGGSRPSTVSTRALVAEGSAASGAGAGGGAPCALRLVLIPINQSIKSSQSRTRAQSHTRARRSPSQRHLKRVANPASRSDAGLGG